MTSLRYELGRYGELENNIHWKFAKIMPWPCEWHVKNTLNVIRQQWAGLVAITIGEMVGKYGRTGNT